MRAPKILAVASAVDLEFRYGCTPAWWQLWKGLYEAGCDLIVTPYRGRAIESPWWRTYPNPAYREGEAFAAARGAVARLKGDRYLRRPEARPPDPRGDRALRAAGGGGLLGCRPGALHPAAGREGARRLLLRVRRQVQARVDARARRRAEPAAARRRLRARRTRLPRRRRRRAGGR